MVLSRNEEQYDQILGILELSCVVYQEKYSDDYRKVLDACLKEYLKNVLRNNKDFYSTVVGEEVNFYRKRSFDKRKGLSRKDFFHIPIKKNRFIKTQRYSAPGYPCLY